MGAMFIGSTIQETKSGLQPSGTGGSKATLTSATLETPRSSLLATRRLGGFPWQSIRICSKRGICATRMSANEQKVKRNALQNQRRRLLATDQLGRAKQDGNNRKLLFWGRRRYRGDSRRRFKWWSAQTSRNNRKSEGQTSSGGSKKQCDSKSAGCLEEYSSTDCSAAKAIKTVLLEKDEWKMVGSWNEPQGTQYVFLQLSTACAFGKTCVKMSLRYRNNPPLWPTYFNTKSHWPLAKTIGHEGDCMLKCRDVPWYVESPYTQNSRTMPYRSCRTAKSIGCKTPSGELGYINKRTDKWVACSSLNNAAHTRRRYRLQRL